MQGLAAFTKNTFLFYSSIFLLLLAGIFISGYNGLYGQDSYEYARYALGWKQFFLHGILPGDYFWPVLYPLLGGILSLALPVQYALLLISMASMLGCALLMEKIVSQKFDVSPLRSRQYTVVLMLLSPILLRSSLTCMSDSLAIFFVLLAWRSFQLLTVSFSRKNLFLFVFAATASVMTRYACILLVVVPAGVIAVQYIRKLKPLDFLFLFLFLFLPAIPHLLVRHAQPLAFLHSAWMQAWSPMNFLRSGFHNQNGNYQYQVQNIVYAFLGFFHPGFVCCGVLLFFWWKTIDWKQGFNRLLVLSICIYSLFLAGIPFQNLRFIIPAVPLFLILFFPVYRAALGNVKACTLLIVFGVAVIQLGLFARALYPFYKANSEERAIASQCASLPSRSLYTFSIDGALKFYGITLQPENLWDKKLDSIRANSYLLFNLPLFEKEYAGKNPMLNYEYIRTHSQLHKLKQLQGGWILYEIR